MPRIRTIKPEFFMDDEIAALDPLARLLFVGLWTQADRAGRLKDKTTRIKAAVLPYDDCDIDALLDSLTEAGFIIRYSVGYDSLIAIRNFDTHQRFNNENPSTLPAPPAVIASVSEDYVSDNVSVIHGKEGKGKGRKGGEGKRASAQDTAALISQAVETFRIPDEQPAGNLPACLSATYDDDVWRSADGVSHETPAVAFWHDVQSARGASVLSPRDRGLFCSAVGDTCPAHCTKTADEVSDCLAVLTKAAKKTDGKPTPLFRKICEEDRG